MVHCDRVDDIAATASRRREHEGPERVFGDAVFTLCLSSRSRLAATRLRAGSHSLQTPRPYQLVRAVDRAAARGERDEAGTTSVARRRARSTARPNHDRGLWSTPTQESSAAAFEYAIIGRRGLQARNPDTRDPAPLPGAHPRAARQNEVPAPLIKCECASRHVPPPAVRRRSCGRRRRG